MPVPDPAAHAPAMHQFPAPPGAGVLLFGGTFDPPHLGHTGTAFAAQDVLGDRAWLVFVPAARSPHKVDKPGASGEDRVAMLALALRALPRCAVWTIELDRARGNAAEPSYWVDTLEHARRCLGPEGDLRFLIGSDQLVALPAWRSCRRILQLATPVVALREPHRSRDSLRRALESSPGWAAPGQTGTDAHRAMAWVFDLPIIQASATRARAALACGDEPPYLDPTVAAYARDRGLYRARPTEMPA